MTEFPGFPRDFFNFFEELQRNNNSEWFNDNKARYYESVVNPISEFIVCIAPRLKTISAHYVADPKPHGGSMFRIYRDTRFSKDKTPYKTHAGVQFRHEAGKDAHAPGYYLHLEPGNCFFGAGIWHPDPKTAATIREYIVANPASWAKIQKAKAFRDRFALTGDSLKRPPRGFDPEHEHITDLMRKDFMIICSIPQKEVCSTKLIPAYMKLCKASAPFVEYLADALELEW